MVVDSDFIRCETHEVASRGVGVDCIAILAAIVRGIGNFQDIVAINGVRVEVNAVDVVLRWLRQFGG